VDLPEKVGSIQQLSSERPVSKIGAAPSSWSIIVGEEKHDAASIYIHTGKNINMKRRF
jgi:hypothetical protein